MAHGSQDKTSVAVGGGSDLRAGFAATTAPSIVRPDADLSHRIRAYVNGMQIWADYLREVPSLPPQEARWPGSWDSLVTQEAGTS